MKTPIRVLTAVKTPLLALSASLFLWGCPPKTQEMTPITPGEDAGATATEMMGADGGQTDGGEAAGDGGAPTGATGPAGKIEGEVAQAVSPLASMNGAAELSWLVGLAVFTMGLSSFQVSRRE